MGKKDTCKLCATVQVPFFTIQQTDQVVYQLFREIPNLMCTTYFVEKYRQNFTNIFSS